MEKDIKEFYYYVKTMDGHPRVTICIVSDNEGRIARGISICSMSETPIKKIGRKQARKRAIKGFYTGKFKIPHQSKTFIRKESIDVILNITIGDINYAPLLFLHEEYNPILTSYESKKISKILNNDVFNSNINNIDNNLIPQQH